jgi:DNA-binding response OmpR family regulator
MAKVLLATDAGPTHTWSLLRVFLESQGHVVSAVHDGESVLTAVPADRPEIVILDTALPTLDGFQVLARLQQRQEPSRLPVLVISSISAQLGSQLAATLGARAYLCKPFTFQTLQQALDEILGTTSRATPVAPLANTAWPAAPPNGTAPRKLRPAAKRQRRGAS